MLGRSKIALGFPWRVVGVSMLFSVAALAAVVALGAGGAAAATVSWLSSAGILLVLLLMGAGGWLVFRQVSPLGDIERQLRTIAQSGALDSLHRVSNRNGATLGWNRLVDLVADRESSASLAERLESALATQSNSNIEDAIQSLSDGLAVTDIEGRISFANRALTALLADSTEDDDLLQECIFDLLADQGEADQELLNTKTARTVVGELSSHTGGGRRLRASRHPLHDSQGQTGYVWTVRDITQQRLADQMRDQFLDSATHELRTPLANIKAYAETLALDDMLDVECQKDFCNTINSEATRLARLIDDLLDLSSMEVGSLSIAKQNVELDRLLRDVVDKVKPLMEQKGLELEVALPEKLPEMQCDKDKLATTLVNLLGNAAKYTPDGGRVALRVKCSDRELQIDVEDTGVGIPEADLPRVFDKFFRGDDPRVQTETGTGLGLAIAREIARLHGGELTARSEVDKGSTFTLTLPMHKGA